MKRLKVSGAVRLIKRLNTTNLYFQAIMGGGYWVFWRSCRGYVESISRNLDRQKSRNIFGRTVKTHAPGTNHIAPKYKYNDIYRPAYFTYCSCYLWYDMIWYDMIYFLAAIVSTPVGSSTVHIYTQTVHRTTKWSRIHRREHRKE